MPTTRVADHLESLLLDIQYASEDIAKCAADPEASADEVERVLLQALETARGVLEGALSHAERNGVPRLAIDAA